jgi:hypothetical protein
MKRIFTLVVLATAALGVFAQSPNKMSYQCVVRNTAGALVSNHAVGIRISILQGSATGTIVFSETYNPVPQTNANGLLIVEIGSGSASTGTIAGIDWAAGPYYLKTETDPEGGVNYTVTGTSQLMSVPYALYAKTASNGFSGNYNDLINKPVLFSGSYNDLTSKPVLFSGSYNDLTNKPVLFDGTWNSLSGKPVFATVATSGSYNDLLNRPSLFDGTWNSLAGKPAGFADGIDNTDDADNSITNEIQVLNLSGTVLTLSNGGGSVTLPSSGGGDNWGTQTVVTNTTLTGNGTTALPLGVANTVITPLWSNLQSIPAGFADGIDNIDDADNSITNEIQALSLSGTTLSLSNGGGSVTIPTDNWGTQTVVTDATLTGNGTTATPLRIAQQSATSGQVLKWNSTSSRWAPANDETGTGGLVLPWSGSSATGIDSYAFTVTSTGEGVTAIRGRQTNITAGSSGCGVYGESNAPNGTAIYAFSNGATGRGLYANGYVAVRANGNYRGVDANGDIAVEGRSYSTTGAGIKGYSVVCGVYGESWNSGGRGVYGKSTGDPVWDVTCGVYGEATTEMAYGVKGYVSDSIGANVGVYGESNSENGYGVLGLSKKIGVYGRSTRFQGTAVKGEATADNSIGIYGMALNTNGTGVYGEGAKQGIYGLSESIGIYGTSTGYKGNGIIGEATGTNSIGLKGLAINTNGTGIWGEGDNQGVYGISAKTTGKGIYGSVSHASGANYGVYGETASAAGYGVYGLGPTYAVYGISNGTNGFGVYGKSTSGTGYGVYGDAIKIGVYGVSTSTTGSGVYGEAQKYGVYGFATLSTGNGVFGEAPVYGVYGRSNGSTGRAVVGEAVGTGSIGVMGLGTNTSSTGVWGEGANYDFYAAGPGTNYGAASSIRWKRNIELIPDPIGKIKSIRGVFYDWDSEHGGRHDVGMIAEEVGKVLPEIVVFEENGIDASGMDYSKVTPLLVEAIKEQQKLIEEQQKQINELKQLVNNLLQQE